LRPLPETRIGLGDFHPFGEIAGVQFEGLAGSPECFIVVKPEGCDLDVLLARPDEIQFDSAFDVCLCGGVVIVVFELIGDSCVDLPVRQGQVLGADRVVGGLVVANGDGVESHHYHRDDGGVDSVRR
jgi:hypothetical protein